MLIYAFCCLATHFDCDFPCVVCLVNAVQKSKPLHASLLVAGEYPPQLISFHHPVFCCVYRPLYCAAFVPLSSFLTWLIWSASVFVH